MQRKKEEEGVGGETKPNVAHEKPTSGLDLFNFTRSDLEYLEKVFEDV